MQRVIDQARTGRVASRVSAISIETPVRRQQGERFDPAELQKIVAIAQRDGIRLHLDGARLFLQTAFTGENIAETVRPFDTVYISLYKYFNAASGAILAGPRAMLDDMYQVRRMFGGGLSHVWPFAAVALHYLTGFGERYGRAVRVSQDLMAGLRRHGGFTIDPFPMGTNLFRLKVQTSDAASLPQTPGRQRRDAVGAAGRHVLGRCQRNDEPDDRGRSDGGVHSRARRVRRGSDLTLALRVSSVQGQHLP